jgi:putative acyl-CoA dehydrogenase
MTGPDPFDVTNQPPPRGDLDLFGADPALRDHARAAGADSPALSRFGTAVGRAATRDLGAEARRVPPDLDVWDAAGRPRDVVRFHPAYHDLMALGLGAGYAALPWEAGAPAGAHATHAAMVYLLTQAEPGVCCPMTMTYAAVPALSADPDLAALWRPRLTARGYDPARRPVAAKAAATMGMAMTEVQGGSDVRANLTRAEPADGHWRLTGRKWFSSAPMSEGFLTLAQAPGGLTCFVVPRWLEEGPNAIRLLRLKDKLGNRANASAEIEYHGARAWQLGADGQGVRNIIAMVHHIRLDTAVAPAGLMRAALAEAHHWVAHRTAFQRRLIDQPLMRAVLADLALDWEGATAFGLHVAAAFGDPARAAYARLAVALAKFLANKRCPPLVAEAMEVMGGGGYIETGPMPMLFRESPLNGIWEGSGNVICLDILRTLAREPEAGAAVAAELRKVAGSDRHFDAGLSDHRARWPGLPPEAEARAFAESLGTLLTASVLIRQAPPAVADAYCASRLVPGRGRIAGSAVTGDVAAILARLGPPD